MRHSEIKRKTSETDIDLSFTLDGNGRYDLSTGIPFFDHMLTLFAVHGSFDLKLHADGDIEVDGHHTVEDIGICLGQALSEALGNKAGITRYGSFSLPMDETLVRVVLDLSNRPFLHYEAPVREPMLGSFDTMLSKEFFRAVCQHGGITLHIDLLHGENGHHIIEAVFKAFGRALAEAVTPLADGRVMSSKGCL
ncbi:imidazoleglycerol-phosphate dehydratase HisB [Desulforhopalus vacuolatus]|uniref:imidazoleglycerol-phosphate dehydratase HisB n=1 Tax=Desulforhopalus vacuolatus TaxID=40414 RepID=UPI001965FE55|nr:imidazoleglycerol-phosphate dehydratase HisB [Desulforhopalus vacuolatus]MBM9518682.1 imidazoleglycerol-phosphate dehydratase HisB [Desulforhopalus vacuolatus]